MTDFSTTSIVELATLVAEHLHSHGIEVVLVGGLAVEIYTENLYLTKDIDMVNINYQAPAKIHAAMLELGFHKKGRVYVNESTDISVEFPSPPLSVGDELIKSTTKLTIANRSIPILKVEDVVKDRIAAYIHWSDKQSLIQAAAIILKHKLKPKMFRQFCEVEGSPDDYSLLEKLCEQASKNRLSTMMELESVLTELLIRRL
ncbi:MAG: hypothetical protein D9N14_20195 [Ketobacter sp.]|nr:MAG: hypothetical protein D9N14_20195 [Ketobacter sp.]